MPVSSVLSDASSTATPSARIYGKLSAFLRSGGYPPTNEKNASERRSLTGSRSLLSTNEPISYFSKVAGPLGSVGGFAGRPGVGSAGPSPYLRVELF